MPWPTPLVRSGQPLTRSITLSDGVARIYCAGCHGQVAETVENTIEANMKESYLPPEEPPS